MSRGLLESMDRFHLDEEADNFRRDTWNRSGRETRGAASGRH
jgi:hypothetical protein